MLVLTFYILTFTVGFPANVFTFATLLGKARRRVSPSDILLLNLTAADLLLLLFLPFKMAEAAAGMTWPLPAFLCPLANFCFYSSIYLSSLFLAALSVERYLGVVFPHHYKDWRRPGRAMAASVVLWLLACSHCSVVFVAQYHGGGGHPEVNGSTPVTSAVRRFRPGGSKMAEGDGFDLIVGPEVFNPGAFKISDVVEEVFKISRSKRSAATGFLRRGATTTAVISKPGGPKPSIPGGPKPSDANVSVSKTTVDVQEISSPTGIFRSARGSSAPGVRHGSDSTEAYKCYQDFSKDQLSFVLPLRLELFLVLFLLPFAVTVFCYVNFVRVLLARPNIPLEKKQRAVGLAMATMVNFGVCFAPYNISHVVGFVEKRSPDWRVYALLLTSLNAALDPLIFYFSSTAVQRAVAGVGTAAGDKLRAAVGWCSSRAPRNESQGSLR